MMAASPIPIWGLAGLECRATPAVGRRCASGFKLSLGSRSSTPDIHRPPISITSPGSGHSIFLADLVHDACTGNWETGKDEDGNPIWNVKGFLEQSLNFAGRMFDVALLWTDLDYLPEPLVAPVVTHLHSAMNPGGQVLAFFHTRTKGEESVHCRFHVTAGDDVEVQLAEPFPIQRAFTNRSIERLFSGWSGHRQFLAKGQRLRSHHDSLDR